MDEVGLLCTWLLVYGSAAWFLNTPSLQEAYANCLPFFGLDHRLQRKVWQHRQKFTPTWIVVFLKTFEVYNLIYLLLRLCFPAGWSTPMSQDWQLCPNLLGLIFIRWSCQPAAQAPQASCGYKDSTRAFQSFIHSCVKSTTPTSSSMVSPSFAWQYISSLAIPGLASPYELR